MTARWPPNETPPAWIVTACPTCGALRDVACATRTGRPVKEPDGVPVARKRKADRIMGAPLATAAAVVTDADFEHMINMAMTGAAPPKPQRPERAPATSPPRAREKPPGFLIQWAPLSA